MRKEQKKVRIDNGKKKTISEMEKQNGVASLNLSEQCISSTETWSIKETDTESKSRRRKLEKIASNLT